MNLFYVSPADIRHPHIRIKGQEAKHISKVMRYSVSDLIMVTDGLGSRFKCEISTINGSEMDLKIIESSSEKRDLPHLTVCVGNIKKRDRLEFSVEKMTELGVDRVIIFTGEYSQKERVRTDRLESAVLAAMKQSLRLFLPAIQVENSLKDALSLCSDDEKLLMADETSTPENSNREQISKSRSLFVVIGPEGGFSEKERKLLQERGAESYSLGKKRLRTETAAIVAADRLKNLS